MELMIKLVVAIAGLAVGGWAGFWIVLFAGGVMMELFPPHHPLAEPGTGLGIGFAAILAGIPIGALVGCYLGIFCVNKIAARRRRVG
jgi:hypothetical protein